jgi:hypothetical protein
LAGCFAGWGSTILHCSAEPSGLAKGMALKKLNAKGAALLSPDKIELTSDFLKIQRVK